jgi:hypothetical protein
MDPFFNFINSIICIFVKNKKMITIHIDSKQERGIRENWKLPKYVGSIRIRTNDKEDCKNPMCYLYFRETWCGTQRERFIGKCNKDGSFRAARERAIRS